MVLGICAFLGFAASVLSCVFSGIRDGRMILMFLGIWLGAFVGLVIAFLLVLLVISLFIGKKEPEPDKHRWVHKVVKLVIEGLCQGGRVKLTVEGMEQIPEGKFLLVSNHRSMFDPIVTVQAFRKYDLAFVSKLGNFKIPLVGNFIRYANFLSIDRTNPRNAIRTINAAADYLKRDMVSIGIYPEGTRSMTDTMLPFHDGVMMIAQKAGVPVVVMTVENTEKIHKNFPLRSTPVRLRIKGVIPAEKVASSRTNELSAEARAMMEQG